VACNDGAERERKPTTGLGRRIGNRTEWDEKPNEFRSLSFIREASSNREEALGEQDRKWMLCSFARTIIFRVSSSFQETPSMPTLAHRY